MSQVTPCLQAISVRYMVGSVMGSHQGTTLLKCRINLLDFDQVEAARKAMAAYFPRWMVCSQFPTSNLGKPALETAALTLFYELIQAVQLEMGIAVGNTLPLRQTVLKDSCVIIYIPTRQAIATETAINWASDVLNTFFTQPARFDLAESLDKVRHQLKPFAEQGVNNFFVLQAAYALDIPIFRPLQDLLVLGTGSLSRWLQSLITDETPMLGVQFAQGKHVTSALLRSVGLPGGVHCLVKTREQAMEVAIAMKQPVVVKPADADRGAGVAAGLTDSLTVALAFDAAVKVSRNVLVERWVPGNTHRLTVQDGQVIRVVRRIAGGVVGDAVHSIEVLVDLFQKTQAQQRLSHRLGYQPLALDEEALALLQEQGLSEKTVLGEGVYLKLRRRDNVNAGGTNEELPPDDLSRVHPDNIRLAVAAAQSLRLDFAGIDFITTDISKSWLEVGGLICEVNSRPQMGGTNDPGLYQRVLKCMFPQGASVPSELILVPQDAAFQIKIMGRLLRERDGTAVSCAHGLWVAGARCASSFKNSFEAAQSLLQRRDVSHAICCMTTQDIYLYGLPVPKWDSVGVMADATFTQEEANQLAEIRVWLQLAVKSQ